MENTTYPSEELLNSTDLANISLLNTTQYDWYEDGNTSSCQPFVVYLQQVLLAYYVPFLVIFGVLGNVLSCMVFLCSPLKAKSSSYYLAALAVADIGFLTNVTIVHFHFRELSFLFSEDGWCQTIVYSSSVFATISVWLVVGFTVERFIAVRYPLRRARLCTVARAKTAICCLTAATFCFQCYVFWTAGVLWTEAGPICEMVPDYIGLMLVINFVDTLATLIVPFFVIVTMNTLMARSLCRADLGFDEEGGRRRCTLRGRRSSQSFELQVRSSSGFRKTVCSTISEESSKTTDDKNKCSRKITPMNMSTTRNQQNTTKMLMIISTVFICLNLPSYLIRLIVFFAFTFQEKEPPEYLWCLQQYAMLLYYTNFSINFLLYSMCGTTFRSYLKDMLMYYFKRLVLCTKRRPRRQNMD